MGGYLKGVMHAERIPGVIDSFVDCRSFTVSFLADKRRDGIFEVLFL